VRSRRSASGGRSVRVQLLFDSNRSVVQEAIAAVRTRLERDGPNPLYVPIMISLMGNRRLRQLARDAVVATASARSRRWCCS